MRAPVVRFDRAALAEARRARIWYEQRSSSAAANFVAELDHCIELISSAPLRWPSYEAGTRRLVMRRFPFAIIYRLLSDTIQIVAVAHTGLRPGYWLDRS
jgi:plasmid stabilization system protein ParE